MVLIVCVDDRFGMMFNQRRQSSDRVVTGKIIELLAGRRLFMDPYSASLFPPSTPLCCNKTFLQMASSGDYCFVERIDVEQYLDRTEKVILFQWNRSYPADMYFPKSVLDNDFKLVECSEFAGSSHERITMKVYEH